jgi:hypothetical protein
MWHTIQVFYYEESRHGLIADAVRPAVEHLERADAFERFWFESHWKRGPHLNLHFDTDGDRFSEQVLPHMRQVLGNYLTAHPSTVVLNEDEVVKKHQKLAESELETGPFGPLYPNNSIQVGEYIVRAEAWGSQEAADIAVSFRAHTAKTVFDLIDHVRDDYHRRLEVAMGLMIATVGATGRLKKRHMCYRSHFEGFLGYSDPDRQIRDAMSDWYQANERWLARTLRKYFAMTEGRKRPDLMMARWLEVVRDYTEQFEVAFEAGVKSFTKEDFARIGEEVKEGFKKSWIDTPSDYHRFMDSLPEGTVLDGAAFDAFRYTVNSTYNWLVVMGLSPLERYFLCYAIARYGETYYGQKWWEIVLSGMTLPEGFELQAVGDGS